MWRIRGTVKCVKEAVHKKTQAPNLAKEIIIPSFYTRMKYVMEPKREHYEPVVGYEAANLCLCYGWLKMVSELTNVAGRA